MESSSMKNMVVLKNLPSNMVDEAIIIFKENSRIKTKDAINKTNKMPAPAHLLALSPLEAKK